MAIKGIISDLPLIVRIDAFNKAEKRQLEYESHIFLICNFLTLFPLFFILLSLTFFPSVPSLLLVSFDCFNVSFAWVLYICTEMITLGFFFHNYFKDMQNWGLVNTLMKLIRHQNVLPFPLAPWLEAVISVFLWHFYYFFPSWQGINLSQCTTHSNNFFGITGKDITLVLQLKKADSKYFAGKYGNESGCVATVNPFEFK